MSMAKFMLCGAVLLVLLQAAMSLPAHRAKRQTWSWWARQQARNQGQRGQRGQRGGQRFGAQGRNGFGGQVGDGVPRLRVEVCRLVRDGADLCNEVAECEAPWTCRQDAALSQNKPLSSEVTYSFCLPPSCEGDVGCGANGDCTLVKIKGMNRSVCLQDGDLDDDTFPGRGFGGGRDDMDDPEVGVFNIDNDDDDNDDGFGDWARGWSNWGRKKRQARTCYNVQCDLSREAFGGRRGGRGGRRVPTTTTTTTTAPAPGGLP